MQDEQHEAQTAEGAETEAIPNAIPLPIAISPPQPFRRKGLFTLTLIASLALALAMQYWMFSNHVYWISSDESGRTHHAWLWAMFPQPSFWAGLLDTWLPLPKILTGLALKYVHPDLFVTPRLLTAFFSVIATLAVLLLAEELFASSAVTTAAGVLSALYSQRIVLSVVPLAEIQYLAWVLLGLWLALRGFRAGRAAWHLAAAAVLVLGMMVRYEAWLVAAFYLLALAWRAAIPPRGVRIWVVLACGVVIALFPAFWLWLFQHYTGKPLGFLEDTAAQFQRHYKTNGWLRFRLSPLYTIVRNNYKNLDAVGLVAVAAWAWRAGARRCWLLAPGGALLAMGVLCTMGKAMPTHNFWRLATLWGMLLVPFTAACCVYFFPRRGFPGRWRWLRGMLSLGLLGGTGFLFFKDAQFMRMCFETLPDLVQTGDYLRAALAKPPPPGQPPTRILMEQTWDYNFLNIEVIARDFSRFDLDNLNAAHPAPPAGEPGQTLFLGRLRQKNLRLLVYRTTAYKNVLLHYPGVKWVTNIGAYTIFEFQGT